jgi:hypothetical protein
MRQTALSVSPGFLKTIGSVMVAMILSGGLSYSLAATSIPQGLDASWTVAASTGIIDDEVPNTRYNVDDGFIETASSAPFDASAERANTVWLRYNVAVPEGFFVKEVIEISDSNVLSVVDDPEQFGGFKLNVRFRDNGAGEQVIVKFMELDSSTGKIEELIRFESDDFESAQAQSDGFKKATADCIFENAKPATAKSFNKTLAALNFDFNFVSGKAYFVRAELVRKSAAGSPALSTIEIRRDLAACG